MTTTIAAPKPGQSCNDLVPRNPPKASEGGWFWDKPDDKTHKHAACYFLQSNVLSGTGERLYGLWAPRGGDAWAVGYAATILWHKPERGSGGP